jgi:hypothetical protein
MAEAEQTYTVFNTENQQTLTVAMPDDHQQGIQYVTQDGVQLSQLPQPEVKSNFKIWIKKTLTLNIILCNMFLYLQVLINKKTSTKTKKNTNCNTVTDLQKVGLSSSSCEY